MSNEAPTWYVKQFSNQAQDVFQPEGNLLKGTTMPYMKITGNQAVFNVAGRGEAVPLVRGARGPEMNAARTTITATLSDYQANDWAWETDVEKMAVEEGPVIQRTCGMAIGRKSDLLIINELNAQTLTTIDATVGGTVLPANAPFTLAMALQGFVELGKQNASDGDLFCILPPLAWTQLQSYKQFNDADWVGYDGLPYNTGQRWKMWNGVKWMMLPDEYFPRFATNTVDFFMWNRRSIGGVDGYNLRTNVSWENLYSGWYHNNRFSAVAKAILPTGMIRFRYGATSAITIN